MKLNFFLRFHTIVGQSLQVAGNFKSAGYPEGQAVPMKWLNDEYWQATVEIDPSHNPEISYQYQLVSEDGSVVTEWGNDRCFKLKQGSGVEVCQFVDTWNHAGEFENVFYTLPFQETLLSHTEDKKTKQPKTYSHIFRVKAPLLKKNEIVCLLGSIPALGEWSTDSPTQLHTEGNWWTVTLDLPKEGFPLQYKYGIYNIKEKLFQQFESGDNRSLFGDAEQHLTIVHDGFLRRPNDTWKGAGVAIPVFSLRSKNSFGVGEFADLPLLVDWASLTGMKLIQLLPVNDTTATNTWTDSYPYAAISAFALHPIFINLQEVAGKKHAAIVKSHKNKQKELNELPAVDYEEVMKIKLTVLKELFLAQKQNWLQDPDYTEFFDRNRFWLVPYAAFCFLRDQNGSPDFTQWKEHASFNAAAISEFVAEDREHHDEILLHYYIQYQLHRQLKDATAYAHKHGIIVKGDIPIGIYRYSCDAWMAPELYNMDQQAGAPPDDFAIKGQNWGFPTYNWKKMEEDGYSWWKQRFAQMREYFDAFRIDHILGFFRIWSIPLSAVEGIMGHFVPSIPVHVNEFNERQIWFNHHRYTRPYITEKILQERFGELQQYVIDSFLEPTGFGQFNFKPAFDTQRKIETWFANQEIRDNVNWLKQGLFDLHSNVILFESETGDGSSFHFRFGMEQTSSFQSLEWDTRQKLKDLYINYFYQRQDDFWKQEAMHKLPALKASTNMLICGEDLGMVPHCVPDVMRQLGILSLEIQRMPKDPKNEFFHPNDAPYLSVVTPSTHDMSTVRGWWEEDRAKTQRFFNQELGQYGEAPVFCEAWISRSIIIQHLYSPAMWSVFQLQDLLGMDAELRRNDPEEERINIPAVAKHYWRYRMHLTLERLLREKSFNNDLKEYIKAGGRA